MDASDRETRTKPLASVFPWVTFLPDEDREQFADKVIDSIKASTSLDRPDLIATLVGQWRNSAELRANPGLKARIESELDRDGPGLAPPD